MTILQIMLHCLLPCLALANEASDQKLADNGSAYSLIQIVPNTNENIELLRYLQTNINVNGMDFWSLPTNVGKTVLVLVHPELNNPFKDLLNQRNMTNNVMTMNIGKMIDDERKQLATEKKRFASSEEATSAQSKGQYPFNLFTFNTLADIDNYTTHISENTANYNPIPGLNVSKHSIGTTHEGRSINMLRISLNEGKKKAAVWLDCGAHSREWISPAFCLYSIDQLVRHPEELLSMYDFYIVPVVNPDGYEYTWIERNDVRCQEWPCRLWRKNRQPTKGSGKSRFRSEKEFSWRKRFQEVMKHFPGIPVNQQLSGGLPSISAQELGEREVPRTFRGRRSSDGAWKFYSRSTCLGTDVNRNFDMDWATSGSSDDPCTDIFHGASPFSEKESKAVRNATLLINSTQKIAAAVSVHAYSQLWLYPYGTMKRVSSHSADLDRVASKSVSALSSLYDTKYRYGQIWKILDPTGNYQAGGNSIDWAHDKVIKLYINEN